MSADNVTFLRLLDNFAWNYNNKLSERLIGCLNNLIFFLGFEGFTHFDKGADLIPWHVLEKDIIFEGDHDTTFGLFGLGYVLMSALSLFMVKKYSSPSLDFPLLFGGMFQSCRVFRLVVYRQLVTKDDFFLDNFLFLWIAIRLFVFMLIDLLEFILRP